MDSQQQIAIEKFSIKEGESSGKIGVEEFAIN
jgi:hypothetical protein